MRAGSVALCLAAVLAGAARALEPLAHGYGPASADTPAAPVWTMGAPPAAAEPAVRYRKGMAVSAGESAPSPERAAAAIDPEAVIHLPTLGGAPPAPTADSPVAVHTAPSAEQPSTGDSGEPSAELPRPARWRDGLQRGGEQVRRASRWLGAALGRGWRAALDGGEQAVAAVIEGVDTEDYPPHRPPPPMPAVRGAAAGVGDSRSAGRRPPAEAHEQPPCDAGHGQLARGRLSWLECYYQLGTSNGHRPRGRP